MKIIFSIASLGSGGAERVLSILSKSLADYFEDIQYVMWENTEIFYEVDSRIKLVSLPVISGCSGRIKQMKAFRVYVKKERPDLIVSFLTPYNILALISTLFLHQRIVVAERTDPKRLLAGGRLILKIRDFLYRRAKGIITQTEYARSCYQGSLSKKTKVIFNPVMMTQSQVGIALRTDKKKVMVTAGRLESVKNQQMMIEAFSFFHQTHKDYKLILYGEGSKRHFLEELISSKNLKDYIFLAGRIDNIWESIASADCFLLSSNYEGMSNAMIEAMCLGLPVISTKVAGATDLIVNGENGFLVDVNDADSMAKRMCQIADDDKLRLNMSANAVKLYDVLKSDRICKQWIEYLNSIILERGTI